MVARSLRKLGLLAVVGLVISACASSSGEAAAGGAAGAAAPAPGDGVQLQVNNNAFGAQDATILLTGGQQQSVGDVPAGQSRTFVLQLEPRSYSLSARTVRGQQNATFTLLSNTTRVVWDMASNRVTTTSR